ncbi:MAG: hypothetical protein COB50_02680 [Thiotrichales bacterium]|nr:MAG: hypothetical protein COB50_02680 [Thiotrichales bacterium]
MKYRFKELIVTGLVYSVSKLPFSMLQCMGYLVGKIASVLPGRCKEVIAANIDICFPNMDAKEKQTLAKKTLIESGKTLFEMPAFWLNSPKKIKPLIKKIYGEEEMLSALGEGHGMILVGPHLGAWEIMNFYMPSDYSVVTLYKPHKMQKLNQLICEARERFGHTMMPTNASGVKALYKALENNKIIGILPDQDPGKGGGRFIDFFGIPTWTMTLITRLLQKTKVSVFSVYVERLGIGKGFNIHLKKLDASIYSEDEKVSLTTMNKAIEECINHVPHQYQWCYKRFKTRPEGEKSIY